MDTVPDWSRYIGKLKSQLSFIIILDPMPEIWSFDQTGPDILENCKEIHFLNRLSDPMSDIWSPAKLRPKTITLSSFNQIDPNIPKNSEHNSFGKWLIRSNVWVSSELSARSGQLENGSYGWNFYKMGCFDDILLPQIFDFYGYPGIEIVSHWPNFRIGCFVENFLILISKNSC